MPGNINRKFVLVLMCLLLLVMLLVACGEDAADAQLGERLDTVEARGKLICAGRTDLAGFGYLDQAGNNVGFDIDLCRAVSAAIFGNANALEVR